MPLLKMHELLPFEKFKKFPENDEFVNIMSVILESTVKTVLTS